MVFIHERWGTDWYDYYKAWPKYYDCYKRFMQTMKDHWNGDLIGNFIRFDALEADPYSLSISNTYSPISLNKCHLQA
ncbi:MAG: hypothetical protein R2766_05290 [Saprospiraceae bacterium]